MSDCKPCAPGHNILFGPGRDIDTSHEFVVKDKPVVLRACGLPDDSCIRVMQRFEVCGESTSCNAVDLNGCPIAVCAASPVGLVYVPGVYYAVLEGAEPEDVTLTVAELPSSITYTINGGGGMGCGPNIVVSSDADSLTVVLDGVVHTITSGSDVSVVETPTAYILTVDGTPAVISKGSQVQVVPGGLVVDGVPVTFPVSTMTANPNGSFTHSAGGANVTIPSAAQQLPTFQPHYGNDNSTVLFYATLTQPV